MVLAQTGLRVVRKYVLPLLLGALVAAVGIGFAVSSMAQGRRLGDYLAGASSRAPFDLDRAVQTFEPDPSGGAQTVTVKDLADQGQTILIRAHLRAEAARFQRGEFGSMATSGAAEMPFLATLRAGAGKLQVSYAEVPGGGRISFVTQDAVLAQAIHDWFAMQLIEQDRRSQPQS